MEDPKITIGFTFIDHYGNEYSATSHEEVFFDFGDRDIDVIGKQLNVFLRQIGFIRTGDYMLMEDLTESEYEALCGYLDVLRNDQSVKE